MHWTKICLITHEHQLLCVGCLSVLKWLFHARIDRKVFNDLQLIVLFFVKISNSCHNNWTVLSLTPLEYFCFMILRQPITGRCQSVFLLKPERIHRLTECFDSTQGQCSHLVLLLPKYSVTLNSNFYHLNVSINIYDVRVLGHPDYTKSLEYPSVHVWRKLYSLHRLFECLNFYKPLCSQSR